MSEPTPRAPDLAERIGQRIFEIAGEHCLKEPEVIRDHMRDAIRTVLRDSVERGELAAVVHALKQNMRHTHFLICRNPQHEEPHRDYQLAQQALAAIERLAGETP